MSTCQFFVQRKSRFCKMRAKEGNLYCGEHLVHEDSTSRVPCPLDPAQYLLIYFGSLCYISCSSVAVNELDKHLLKCNARPGPTKPYFRKDCNVFGDTDELSESALEDSGNFAGMEPCDYKELVEKVRNIRHRLELDPVSIPGEYREDTGSISEGEKEKLQKDVLCKMVLGKVSNHSGSKLVILEMGCGKGGLSHHLITTNPDVFKGVQFYLVDRDNFRGKLDSQAAAAGVNVERAKIDIKDLNLDKMIGDEVESVIVISKHLCGAATCLTLVALKNLALSRPNLNIEVVVALCCHQRCTAGMFCQQSLISSDYFTPKEFKRVCGLCSWAVCGWRYGIKEGGDFHFSGYSYDECKQIGLECKALLNWGRTEFLGEAGFTSQVVPYITEEVTLENKVLIATTNKI